MTKQALKPTKHIQDGKTHLEAWREEQTARWTQKDTDRVIETHQGLLKAIAAAEKQDKIAQISAIKRIEKRLSEWEKIAEDDKRNLELFNMGYDS